MVKIAIAGGSGEVAREITDALLATGKHEIIALSRNDVTDQEIVPGLSWVQVDYANGSQLTEVLQGVHTVLSFILAESDPGSVSQKSLIDSCIRAGVKRFAPSEWALSNINKVEVYTGKLAIRKYLAALNKDTKVLEYCLFQPGLFLNYLTHPYQSAKHVTTFAMQFDFHNRRALVSDEDDDRITLTTTDDLGGVVARAVEYEGEWPVVGGIRGCELSVAELIRLGEEIRGGPFKVEKLRTEDLEAGIVKSSWVPHFTHHAIPPEKLEEMERRMVAGITLGIRTGGLIMSDEWNRLLPDYKFTQPREFLTEAWRGKP